MRRIKIRPAAVDDLDEHVLFISRDSVDAAMRLFDSAHRSYRQISKMPQMGTVCDIPNPRLMGLRRSYVKGFRNYVIYYIPRDDEIEIIRLLHGARDRENILLRER